MPSHTILTTRELQAVCDALQTSIHFVAQAVKEAPKGPGKMAGQAHLTHWRSALSKLKALDEAAPAGENGFMVIREGA